MKTKKAGTTEQMLALDFPTTHTTCMYPLLFDFPPPAYAESFSLNVWESSSSFLLSGSRSHEGSSCAGSVGTRSTLDVGWGTL